MKYAISFIMSSVFCFISLKAQNIECIGNTINIPLSGYKAGKIQWQFSSDKNTWNNLAGKTTINLQYTITGTGYFRAKITYGQCEYYSDTTFIKAYPVPTLAYAGADRAITSTDTIVTLSASPAISGRGKWTIVSGSGGVLTNDTLHNTTFKGRSCNDYVLRWTISTGCLTSTDDVKIGFHATPSIANAGMDQTLLNFDTIVLLSANRPVIGDGKWTILTGTGGVLEDNVMQNTIFKGLSCNDYVLRWTISTVCMISTDDVKIGFHATPSIANAGSDQSLINTDTVVLLSANKPQTGNGKWSIVSGNGGILANDIAENTTFKGKSCTDYVLRWTISTGCMASSDDVNVGFYATPTTAYAGPDQIKQRDSTFNLMANLPLTGEGIWKVMEGQGGLLGDSSDFNSTFRARKCTNYILRWTISTVCDFSFDEVNIVSLDSVRDIEGNAYSTIKIGNQIWMVENLKTTRYNDNQKLTNIENATEWISATIPAFCWYDNDSLNKNVYGALYNWEAINRKNICPVSWHVSTEDDWNILTDFVGGIGWAGGRLKEAGFTHWIGLNNYGTNEYGFTGLPGGCRDLDGVFYGIGGVGIWWTSTELSLSEAIFRSLFGFWGDIHFGNHNKNWGSSIRCVKDK